MKKIKKFIRNSSCWCKPPGWYRQMCYFEYSFFYSLHVLYAILKKYIHCYYYYSLCECVSVSESPCRTFWSNASQLERKNRRAAVYPAKEVSNIVDGNLEKIDTRGTAIEKKEHPFLFGIDVRIARDPIERRPLFPFLFCFKPNRKCMTRSLSSPIISVRTLKFFCTF